VTNVTLRSRLRPVMEPPQLSKREVEYDQHVLEPEDLTSPPTALSWVCFVSGSILRGFDPAHPDPLSSPRSPLGTAISRTTAACPPPGWPIRTGLICFVTCAPWGMQIPGREG